MISDKKWEKIILDTYNELYHECIPEADFYKLRDNCLIYENSNYEKVIVEKPYTTEECKNLGLKRNINYYAYYIPEKLYREIVENAEKKYKIKGQERNSFHMSMYLGCGPTSSKKRWLEKHPEYTMGDLNRMIKEKYSEDYIENEDD